jgi:hypothetical protein
MQSQWWGSLVTISNRIEERFVTIFFSRFNGKFLSRPQNVLNFQIKDVSVMGSNLRVRINGDGILGYISTMKERERN